MSPHPVDVHVGSRLRLRRTLKGLSQEKLGAAVGLTFQQIQKYERGANRIGASRLFQLSRVLQVPPSFFFEDMQTGANSGQPGLSDSPGSGFEHRQLTKRETLELVRVYYKITDATVRKRVFELVKAIAGQPAAEVEKAD